MKHKFNGYFSLNYFDIKQSIYLSICFLTASIAILIPMHVLHYSYSIKTEYQNKINIQVFDATSITVSNIVSSIEKLGNVIDIKVNNEKSNIYTNIDITTSPKFKKKGPEIESYISPITSKIIVDDNYSKINLAQKLFLITITIHGISLILLLISFKRLIRVVLLTQILKILDPIKQIMKLNIREVFIRSLIFKKSILISSISISMSLFLSILIMLYIPEIKIDIINQELISSSSFRVLLMQVISFYMALALISIFESINISKTDFDQIKN